MRAKVNKLNRNFNKGLITEAGYLTYPDDASIDELNTVLSRKGNRTRRFGFNRETDGAGIPNLSFAGDFSGIATNEFSWLAVANKPVLNFLVQQVGDTIIFGDQTKVPKSSGYFSYTIDLKAYKASNLTETDIKTKFAQFSLGKGYLFIAHPLCETIIVEYDPVTSTFSAIPLLVQIRDFKGVNDNLANDEEPLTLSVEHNYNLVNQGWLKPGPLPGGTPVGDPVYVNPYTGTANTYFPYGAPGFNIP